MYRLLVLTFSNHFSLGIIIQTHCHNLYIAILSTQSKIIKKLPVEDWIWIYINIFNPSVGTE